MTTTKYHHIRNMKQLDDELLKLKLKKRIIEEELLNNVDEFKRSLSPRHLIGEALGIDVSHQTGSKIFSTIKSLAIAFSVVRGGVGVYNRVKRLFRK